MKRMLLLSLFLLLLLGNAIAQGAGELLIVNGRGSLCAIVPSGDECLRCDPLPGWDILGSPGFSHCPEGFEFVDVKPSCFPIKSTECCTAGHLGSAGDCGGLALNAKLGQCAFVETSANCGLPDGWVPSAMGGVGPTLCPASHAWVGGIKCIEGRPGPMPPKPGNGTGTGNGTGNRQTGPDFVLVAAGLLVLALAAALIYTNTLAGKKKEEGSEENPVESKGQFSGGGQFPENGPDAKKL